MWKKMISFALLLFIPLLLTGCWDNKELKNIDVVTSLGLDAVPIETKLIPNEIQVTIETLKADKALEVGNKDSSKYFIGQGESILAAIHQVYQKGAKTLSWPHNRLIVLGNDLVQQPADSYLDYLVRSYEIRPTSLLVLAQGTAQELLQTIDQQDITASANLLTILDKEEQGIRENFLVITLQDFMNDLLGTGIDPVLPIAETTKDNSIFIQSAAAFRKGKIAGVLTPAETQGLLWLRNQIQHHTITIASNATTKQSVELLSTEANIKVKQTATGAANLQIYIQWQGALKESARKLPATEQVQNQEKIIAMTEEALNQQIKQTILAAIAKSQQLQSDFLGLGQAIYRQEPQLWQNIAQQNYLSILQPEIYINGDLTFLGDTAQDFLPSSS